jgi:predicted nuclease of predicted toxin-antitoxin system
VPHETPTFFVDRSLGSRQIAERLRAASARVEVLADHFADDCPDAEWLDVVGRLGWLVLTKDKKIRRRRAELAAMQRAKVGVFLLTAGNRTGAEMADVLCDHLERMSELAKTQSRPFLALVRAHGVEVWKGGR